MVNHDVLHPIIILGRYNHEGTPTHPGTKQFTGHKNNEIATALREAELINGILTNAEVWYGVQQNEIDELEEVDKLLLRRILGAPDSTCIESLYLDGTYPNTDTHKGQEDQLSPLPYPVERRRNALKSISNTIEIPCKR